ncbi:flagellar motor protein MotS [Pontibacillus halophilus JSM 076056 = DSM 19796]|uniref:Flagellar motor protein MotS n=1 Tax=Pontibacillus halophilus JSM 076056 = DSM 19796 TaxID=1385510 RepID=A0A0A5G8C9_9BACI|nr:flagellar motor protein MotS [Pontibacillus halophilus]KGX89396.1 flagellar motor protein MotS [Pontibacillus halophilus JSM 076056 = DSM 19796]
MKRNRKQKKVDKGAPKWMVTYSDMMTLILVFFILLFSMSQIDLVKFQAIADSFESRGIFDFYPSIVEFEQPSEKQNQELNVNDVNQYEIQGQNNQDNDELGGQSEEKLDELVLEVQAFLERNDMTDSITTNRTERGVVLILEEQVLFESGQASIIAEGEPFLNKVAVLLSEIPHHVKIEGHTDDRPISTYRYPSNWELSAARASSVIRYLTTEYPVDPSRFSAVGYGDTRPRVSNDTENNLRTNRRVEIVILDPQYDGAEAR